LSWHLPFVLVLSMSGQGGTSGTRRAAAVGGGTDAAPAIGPADSPEMAELRRQLEAMILEKEDAERRAKFERKEKEDAERRAKFEREEKEREREEKEREREEKERERAGREEAERREKMEREEKERERELGKNEWIAKMQGAWPPDIGRLGKVIFAPSSTSHVNPDHEPAKLIRAVVQFVDRDFRYAEKANGQFNAALSTHAVTTEGDVVPFVNGAIRDVIAALGLNLYLNIESKFDNVKPDSWVLRTRFGHPVGVVEVKKPPKHKEDPLEADKVFGEVFDALRVLRDRWGVRPAIAILSTGWEWRLLWWDGEKEWAAMKVSRPSGDALEEEDARELGASQIIAWDNGARRNCEYAGTRFMYSYEVHPVVDLIAGALCVMERSAPEIPDGDPFLNADERAFAILKTERQADWVKGAGSSGADWSWDQMPGRKVVHMIVVSPLGSGRDGSAFLVGHLTSKTVGVLKWAKARDDLDPPRTCEDVARQEAANWAAAYGHGTFSGVRCGRWDGGHAVLLPYLKPLEPADRQAALDDNSVADALTAMAKRRFCHDDVKWSHVARRVRWEKREGGVPSSLVHHGGIVLIDLAGGRAIPDGETWDSVLWVKNCLKYLGETMNE
jgi:hypothetical protein